MKLLRKTTPDPQQLGLQLDFFAPDTSPRPDHPAPLPRTDSVVVTPAPPVAPPAPGKRRIQLGDHTLDYDFGRSKRRSIGFVIDDDGLRVTAPKWATLADVDSALRGKQRWILTKLKERRERSARRLQPAMEWRDGATLPYLGGEITLRILTQQAMVIRFDPEARELTVSLQQDAAEQQLKDRVQSWLQAEAHRLFAERLPVYAEKLGVSFHSFKLSSAQTQWGSCTTAGKIRLNWRLIHFSLPLIDYVIAHELAHLREMNHSPRFWATVQSVFPEFVAAKSALRERARETLPVF